VSGSSRERFAIDAQETNRSVEKGDNAVREVYAQALKQDLPPPLRKLLERQQEPIQRVHEKVRALHDLG
jgi:hypothetical protein